MEVTEKAIFDAEAVNEILESGQNLRTEFLQGLKSGAYKIFSSEKAKLYEDEDIKKEIEGLGVKVIMACSKEIRDHSRIQSKTMPISDFPPDSRDLDLISAGATSGVPIVTGQKISMSLTKKEIGQKMGATVLNVDEFFV